VRGLLPTPDPNRLVLLEDATGTHHVRILDLKTEKVAKDFGERWVSDCTLSPDGKALWAVGSFGLNAWDLTALRAAGEDDDPQAECLAFVPGADRLLVGNENTHRTRLAVYRVDGFGVERLRAVQEHRRDITSLAVSPDGRLAASGDESGVIKVWDVPTLTRP
jgi:WD40 repeat protein